MIPNYIKSFFPRANTYTDNKITSAPILPVHGISFMVGIIYNYKGIINYNIIQRARRLSPVFGVVQFIPCSLLSILNKLCSN